MPRKLEWEVCTWTKPGKISQKVMKNNSCEKSNTQNQWPNNVVNGHLCIPFVKFNSAQNFGILIQLSGPNFSINDKMVVLTKRLKLLNN